MAGFTSAVLHHAKADAEEKFPQESCGIVVMDNQDRQSYVECENVHTEPEKAFRIKPEIIRKFQRMLLAVVHSHPGQVKPEPSETDRRAQKAMGIPWLIVSIVDGEAGEVHIMGDKAGWIANEPCN